MASFRQLLALAACAFLAACSEAATDPAPRPFAHPAAATTRLQERFDADWRFFRGDEPDAASVTFADAAWRRVDLPHDFSIEDLPAPATLPTVSAEQGTWRFKAGDEADWKSPALDDSTWREVKLPAPFSQLKLEKPENSYAWYRGRLAVPAELRDKEVVLLLGKVDDADETFINGTRIGGLGKFPPNFVTAWDTARRYRIPPGLLKCDGTDVVAVRCYNGAGDGGLFALVGPVVHSGPFSSDSINGIAQGYTEGAVAWYRKTFTLPEHLRGKALRITFDGVYMNAEIFFNGQKLGVHPYGYTSFSVDLTPQARFGNEPNVLAVKVDSTGRTSRWYSGSGIYRHVWLTATDALHIAPWGIAVTTPQASGQQATVRVRAAVANGRTSAQKATLAARVLDARGMEVAAGTRQGDIPAGVSQEFDQTLTVANPALWSPESPALYTLVTSLQAGDKTVDEVRTPFGIRTISVDVERGFVLNGQPLKLRGGCVHHDNGPLGSAAYDRAEERRVELLKSAGFNAIRTAHNPPSPAFLEACDRLGMLVMDEAFDCWKRGKNSGDYSRFFTDWWQKDLDSMILRDRNHPSVIFWSIGNEIWGQDTPEFGQTAALLAGRVRELDPTRPVAQAAHPGETRDLPVFSHVDICGYNYMPGNYEPDHKAHPQRIMCGTESFPRDAFGAWMAVVDRPWVIGDFVWTAFDYLGEAGLGKAIPSSTPPGPADTRLWTAANCGDFDICGFKRPPSYYRDALWNNGAKVSCFVEAPGPDGKTTQVPGWNWGWIDERPSWTWPGLNGKPLQVHVYSPAPQVRLTINGRDLGTKPAGRQAEFRATWMLPYEPGELVALALDEQNKEVGRWTLRTADKPAVLRLTPDRTALAADGQDLSYVTVEITDARGTLDPTAEALVHFTLTGPGKIVAVGNADPRSTESFQQPTRHAWQGRCLVVIKAAQQPGEIHLKAQTPGLPEAETILRTSAAKR